MNETVQALQATLSEYDFRVIVDASGSMGERDVKGRSRWDSMQESVGAFVRDVEAIDTDGIDIIVMGGGVTVHPAVTSDKLKTVFDRAPRGGTPLAEALTEALRVPTNKKQFNIVFTDGVPDDQAAVQRVILAQAQKQSRDDECTILFVQVGYDRDATTYLKMLDDNLRGAKFDIVDAKTIDEAEKFGSTAELVAHAIND
jgi:uncharacterized protein YegL